MKNYSIPKINNEPESTILTQVLVNVAPHMTKARTIMDSFEKEPVDDESKKKMGEELNQCLPSGYAGNYVDAYRVCQDQPGGTI
jgi:hypothetical protein